MIVTKLGDMERTDRLGGVPERTRQVLRYGRQGRVEFGTADPRFDDIDAVEPIRERSDRAIAAVTDLGDDPPHRFGGTVTGGIGTRKPGDECIAGTSAEIESVQHDTRR